MPSERAPAMSSRHLARSQGVKPNASSGVSVAGWIGRGFDREGLGRRQRLAGCGALRNRALLDGEQRRAGAPIEEEQMAHLGGLDQRGNRGAVRREIEEHGLRGRVVVPQVVVHGAEVPAHETRVGVERDDRARVEVEAVALSAVVVGRRVARGHVDEAERGIGRERSPCVGRTAPVRVAGFARERGAARRHRIPRPHARTRARIPGAHDAAWRVGAAVVEHERARDHAIADHRRRRGHSVLTGFDVADALAQVHGAGGPEIRARGAGGRVERDQPRIERARVDARAAARVLGRARIDPRRHATAIHVVHAFA